MRYICEKCSTEYDLTKEQLGVPLECQCGNKFTVPDPASQSTGPHIGLFILHIIAGITGLAGVFLLIVAAVNFGTEGRTAALLPLAVGVLLFLFGCLLSGVALCGDKLDSIEWHLSRLNKKIK